MRRRFLVVLLIIFFLGLSIVEATAVTATRGYIYTDPARFGSLWLAESQLERARPPGECHCEEDPNAELWATFLRDLQGNLAVDPDFTGAWVHPLCGFAYPILFKFVSLDEMGLLSVRGGCSAGLVSMAVVCAQSVALQAHVPSLWQWTERVVKDEGESVGDVDGYVPVAECLRRCETQLNCASVAHGPHGCHLKNKCVESDADLQELDSDYRTFFKPCRSHAPEVRQFKTLGELRSAKIFPSDQSDERDVSSSSSASLRIDELLLLLDIATQLLEKAAPCLGTSSWPFQVVEIVENLIELHEEPAHFLWSRVLAQGGVGTGMAAALTAPVGQVDGPLIKNLGHGFEASALVGGSTGAIRRTLERCLIRWARNLRTEVDFWKGLLSPLGIGVVAESSDADVKLAHEWLKTGQVRWAWDDICGYVSSARPAPISGRNRQRPLHVLNAGSGPLAAGPLRCDSHEVAIPVVSSDGLAKSYSKIFDTLEVQPPHTPMHCPVELLRRCFPRDHFDVAHMRNSLDHAVDPLLGIQQLLEVTRPGGWVLLRHARNEGVPGQFRVGLHQWAFDVASDARASRFVIWSPSLRADVSSWLLASGLASSVKAEIRPHPAGGEEEYVWVDIQKPHDA